jgi:hypothetical protein
MTVTELNAYKWRRAACFWQSITVTWQWSIAFVFWGFCAAEFLPPVNWFWRLGLIAAHTYPFILVMIEFYLCDSQIRLRDFWSTWVLVVLYGFVNYYYTMIGQEPAYPFLLWKQPVADVLHITMVAAFGTAMMLVTAWG